MRPDRESRPAGNRAADVSAGEVEDVAIVAPAPDSKARTGGGRLAAAYVERVAAAREQVAATDHPHGVTDRTTPELMALDNAYTGLGAVLRRRDRDIQRLRRVERRSIERSGFDAETRDATCED